MPPNVFVSSGGGGGDIGVAAAAASELTAAEPGAELLRFTTQVFVEGSQVPFAPQLDESVGSQLEPMFCDCPPSEAGVATLLDPPTPGTSHFKVCKLHCSPKLAEQLD